MTTQQAAESNQLIPFQCHGGDVGPMGVLRRGNGSVQGGVPFIAKTLGSHQGRYDLDSMGAYIPIIAKPLAHGRASDHYDESQQTYVAFDTTQITSPLNRSNPQTGDPCHPLAAKGHAPSIAWHENKQGELTPSNIARALRAGASHSYQGIGVRRLTPTECERLQGFPDNWTVVNGMKDSTRYRMLGNAVCVPVAEWLGRRIVMQDKCSFLA